MGEDAQFEHVAHRLTVLSPQYGELWERPERHTAGGDRQPDLRLCRGPSHLQRDLRAEQYSGWTLWVQTVRHRVFQPDRQRAAADKSDHNGSRIPFRWADCGLHRRSFQCDFLAYAHRWNTSHAFLGRDLCRSDAETSGRGYDQPAIRRVRAGASHPDRFSRVLRPLLPGTAAEFPDRSAADRDSKWRSIVIHAAARRTRRGAPVWGDDPLPGLDAGCRQFSDPGE